MSRIAKEFLTRCFAPGETIALLLRNENPVRTRQRIVALERVLGSRYRAWLSHENHLGANVYVAANPLRPRSRKRTKESIATVRHLYLDIDTDGDSRLATLRASEHVPIPSAILSTSPGKYQIFWRVDDFDFEHQEQALKLLAIAFGGDPACTDCNRVLRLPGFMNRKCNPAHLVTVEYPSDSVGTPADFRLNTEMLDAFPFDDAIRSQEHFAKNSNSESDWAWVLGELAHGRDAAKLTQKLASRRSDKPNPLYYAQRTVDVASARLWLIEGQSIDAVMAMLNARRSPEIPRALCFARAREIAATAKRMITRKRTV